MWVICFIDVIWRGLSAAPAVGCVIPNFVANVIFYSAVLYGMLYSIIPEATFFLL